MSLRTFRRRREAGARPLSQEQSARTWKFAGILAKATQVFGSQAEAELWMEQQAIALEQRRPIDRADHAGGRGNRRRSAAASGIRRVRLRRWR